MSEKISPFEFVGSINDKRYLMVSPEIERQYIPFVVNRALSATLDTMPFVEFLNRHPALPNKLQYDYLFYRLRKMKRYGKWEKNEKHEYLEDVVKYYRVSQQKASEIVDRLTTDQLKILRHKNTNFGGRVSSVNTR